MLRQHLSVYTTILAVLCLAACTAKKGIVVPAAKEATFNTEQLALINSATASDPMRVWKTTSKTDSLLLRSESEAIDLETADAAQVQLLADRLYATVRDSISMGVGIAAPQVGILKDMIWVQRFDKEGFPFEVYINPVIRQYSTKKQDCREGCLSIPDRSDTTKTRAYAILLEYDRLSGDHITEMVEDFTAVIFQHEIDHLHGVLYLDHLD